MSPVSSCSSYLLIQSLVTAESVDDLSYLCKESTFRESETRFELSRGDKREYRGDMCERNAPHKEGVPVHWQPEHELEVFAKWLQT